MRTNKKVFIGMVCLCVFSTLLNAQVAELFQIQDVKYDIKGATLEYPLTQAVLIDTKRIFLNRDKFDFYIEDLRVQFNNQRIFQSSSIDVQYGSPNADGVIPVFLTVHTKDTWNIIALPYPKYDSNSGFQFKLKIKDYNFFGSMQVMNGDVNYEIDNAGKTAINANLNFGIPFKAWEYSCNWSNDFSLSFPQGEIPEFNATSGMNIALPLGFTSMNFGVKQSLSINDRNDTALYRDDTYYFKDEFYTNLPITLYKFNYIGNFSWTPSASFSTNWAFDGIQHADLQGPSVSWGHSLGIGRVDWHGNFRTGITSGIGNSYSYNMHNGGKIAVSVDGSVTAFSSFFDRVGLYTRATGFYNFYNALSTAPGGKLRGILDNRISTDTAFTLNVDIPLRIMRVNFLEITGVSWTKYIGFDMNVAPFFDMALTHDTKTGQYYSLNDGWYSGGIELIIYPMKMRSIYGRISAGFDLAEVAHNGGKLSGYSSRDGKSIRELYLGIGHFY